MRFGILCNGVTLEAWEAAVLAHLSELECKPELTLAIIDASPAAHAPQPSRTVFEKLRSVGCSNLLYYFFCRYFFKPESKKPVSLEPFLKNLETLRVDASTSNKFIHKFPDEAIQTIKSKNLDFILRFGFNILKGDILSSARFGVWSFHHDDEEKYRGGPPAFWEIYHRDRVTGSVLQKLTEKLDAGIILKKGYLKTFRYSPAKNLDQVYWESAKWPAALCHDITKQNVDLAEFRPSKTTAKIFRPPKNFQMVRFFFVLFLEKSLARYRNWFRKDIWSIGVLRKPIHNVLSDDPIVPDLVIKHPKKNNYLADPFCVSMANGLEIFCEEYSYKDPAGRICHFQLTEESFNKKATFPNLEMIAAPLDQNHYSYPHTVVIEGATYLTPECFQSNRVELWKLSQDGKKIENVKVLVPNVKAVDPTLFKFGDLYWLAFTLEDVGPNSHLFLWYSTDIWGSWNEHEGNPVKIDIRSARPAGTVFEHEGRSYRPSQDCSIDYGYRIVLNKIDKLTPRLFLESTVKTIEPIKGYGYNQGLHTLSAAGPYTLIDMKSKRVVWSTVRENLSLRIGFQRITYPNQV